MPIDWRDWSEEAFSEAGERRCPVLLLLHASWCRWSRELEERVLADPRIAGFVREHFVAVRVEKDRRPDIDARYRHGGWPTLAYLSSSGEQLEAHNWLDVPELLEQLRTMAAHAAGPRARSAGSSQPREQVAQPPAAPELPSFPEPAIVDWVAKTVQDTADPEFGGWGQEHKFPHPEAIDFALLRWSQTGDDAMRQLVLRTLRHMSSGRIHDRVDGGFYRYATQRDWGNPHSEKMLDSNAQRLYAYVEAYQAFSEPSFADTARGILRWMESTLFDQQTGAYRGSQDADPTYANLRTREARERHARPPCDPTLFANWNAMAASALLKASVVLEDDRWRVRAEGILDFLLAELYDDRLGIYHYWDGTYHLPGLLSDQAYFVRAALDACQHAGRNDLLEPARRVADLAIERLRSPAGSFFDKPHEPRALGGLRQRDRSLLENAVMAEALLRLSYRTQDDDYADCAVSALQAFAQDYKRYGHFVAGYGRAVDLLLHPPVVITIVAATGDPAGDALFQAALRPYVASRIVQRLDPERDAALLAMNQLQGPDAGCDRGARAYVQRGRGSWAETGDPHRLPALMTGIERS